MLQERCGILGPDTPGPNLAPITVAADGSLLAAAAGVHLQHSEAQRSSALQD